MTKIMNTSGNESIFEVEKVIVKSLPERCRQHYPKYKIHSFERAICKSLQQAEDALKRYVEIYRDEHPRDWCEDVFCYYIKEYPLGVHITPSEDWMLSWRMYDAEGEIIDRSVCCGHDANKDFSEFKGRDADQIRFKEGDIVEFVWRDEVMLGFVLSMPPSLEEVKERWEKNILDSSEDSYVVLTTSDYVSHNHVSSMDIFAPHYPVPNYMRKRLNESYRKYLKRYKNV